MNPSSEMVIWHFVIVMSIQTITPAQTERSRRSRVRVVTDGRRRLIAAVALIAAAVFAVLTILVMSGDTPGLDTSAFDAIDHVRAPWLDRTAKVITTLGLLVFAGPAVLLAAAALFRAGRRVRAAALVLGVTLTWVGVWITKWAVD